MSDEENYIGIRHCSCGNSLKYSIKSYNVNILRCDQCGKLFSYLIHKVDSPDNFLNKRIFCISNKTALFLEKGLVDKVDHLHVHVVFDNGVKLWLPTNSVREIYEEDD